MILKVACVIDFHGITNINELDPGSILMNHVAYKPPSGVNPLRLIFDKVVGCIRKYYRTKYLGFISFWWEIWKNAW